MWILTDHLVFISCLFKNWDFPHPGPNSIFFLSPILKFDIYISILLGAHLDILICMLFLTNPEVNQF